MKIVARDIPPRAAWALEQSGLHPLLANCLRLTVGTPDENTLMIDALKASL